MSGVSLEGVEPGGAPWRLEAATGAELAAGRAQSPSQAPSSNQAPSRHEALHLDRLTAEGGLHGCLACGHPELYTQRDFPRRLGIAVVVVAAVLAPFTWYLSLGVAAVLDAVLFWTARTLVACYVCGAHHRGFAGEPRHPRYDLGIAERLRYGPKAVMGTPQRPSGTAGAPDPEH